VSKPSPVREQLTIANKDGELYEFAERLIDGIEEALGKEWEPVTGDGIYHLRRKLLATRQVLERLLEGRDE
jgi:hypothetical protein